MNAAVIVNEISKSSGYSFLQGYLAVFFAKGRLWVAWLFRTNTRVIDAFDAAYFSLNRKHAMRKT